MMMLDEILAQQYQGKTFEDVRVVGNSIRRGEQHNWEIYQYTALCDGQRVNGRVYVTTIESAIYSVVLNLPLDNRLSQLFIPRFEKMLDRFTD